MTVLYRRWLGGFLSSNLPQAMAPLGYSLATVWMVGGAHVGAAMVTATMACQVIFAVPLGKLGDRFNTVRFLRLALVLRALAVCALLVALIGHAGEPVLIGLAGVSGMAGGAIYGSFRALLSSIATPDQLPKRLALAATVSEVMFAGGPVLASALAVLIPVLPIAVMAAASLSSALLVPAVATQPTHREANGPRIPLVFGMWMGFALVGEAAVALIEVGAVTLALRLGLPAPLAVIFTLTLCAASITGGVLVTWRTGVAATRPAFVMLGVTLAGMVCIGLAGSVLLAAIGAVCVGLCLAPLATFYSLSAERSLPKNRRAEGFSWLRAASGVGVSGASLLIAIAPLSLAALCIGAALIVVIVAFGYLNHSSRLSRTKESSVSHG